MQLVMIETNGNQNYIFSSPRLRENIGASAQLTWLEDWTQEVLDTTTIPAAVARAFPEGAPDLPWVSRSSGKVIFLADSVDSAREVIGRVTRIAHSRAPGIDVTGVYVEMDSVYVDDEDLRRVHMAANEHALDRPPAGARFSQMPFLVRAQDSSLPAAPPFDKKKVDDEATADLSMAYSLPSRVKRYHAAKARKDLVDRALADHGSLWKEHPYRDNTDQLGELLVRDLRNLEKLFDTDPEFGDDRLSKVAVVHIDGNGVGAIMSHLKEAKQKVPENVFSEATGVSQGDDDALRRFLLQINTRLAGAMETAFYSAWAQVSLWSAKDDELRGRHIKPHGFRAVPVVPVILGGDDATVITEGAYALPFTAAFLEAFERETAADSLLSALGNRDDHMTAGAGIAVVRHAFPFHIAYDLAETLIKKAKQVGKAADPDEYCSTLTFHALFDSTLLDDEALIDSYSSFTERPYRFVTKDYDAPGNMTWHEACRLTALFTGVGKVLPDKSTDPATWRIEYVSDPTQRVPFPKTRAARIRQYMSEAANAPEPAAQPAPEAPVNDDVEDRIATGAAPEKSPGERVNDEWAAILGSSDEDLVALAKALGSPDALFDLLELADLLPVSYLQDQLVSTAYTQEAGE
ncbi:Cas10/Cmr2 second palm domain-containing protein [Actinomyces glycerinitolerans]|uniref:Cas10/Cmr2 second palm domain-containing protein n=1 Tax=Actinomyces glycerinitolerans TaxID=1892869 RepID=A0A1M4RZN3_9ACTO|nr:hypothetical protein [Actinomyces glycerinitolerans]SHE25389.1 Hypothetical protein ACGLYG10_1605 [Actinomyces glycerinitolerans]